MRNVPCLKVNQLHVSEVCHASRNAIGGMGRIGKLIYCGGASCCAVFTGDVQISVRSGAWAVAARSIHPELRKVSSGWKRGLPPAIRILRPACKYLAAADDGRFIGVIGV